ncbi:hypothetical protein TCAL_15003 [Tigriopus californicus]|uniref:Retrotransposon gag domain-containing protein n=1 Tax=Tigriopus californicus TaxID=6832 RepID=A0A553NYA5_TIGCA|nr:hypothetical protein TCAL_15003 [Tigriopus californicus]
MFAALLEVGSKALDECEDDAKRSWVALKRIFGARQEETYREAEVQKFFQLRKDGVESVDQYLGRVKDSVEACFSKFAKANRDQLKRDAFVNGLPTTLKTAVLNRDAKKLGEAVETAMMAEQVEKTLNKDTKDKSKNQDSYGRRNIDGNYADYYSFITTEDCEIAKCHTNRPAMMTKGSNSRQLT